MRVQWMVIVFLLTACAQGGSEAPPLGRDRGSAESDLQATSVATFAGGCFWCIEAPFEKVPGVVDAVSGYTGGRVLNPTYQQVGSGTTGHTEAVQVHYDSSIVSYEQLLDLFWRQFDPTDSGGSFVDRGSQYRPGIFYHNEGQRVVAEESRRRLEDSGQFEKPLATPIVPLEVFFEAEPYHQDFYKKDPQRYRSYRRGSGRDRFLDRVWGDKREPTWVGELKKTSATSGG